MSLIHVEDVDGSIHDLEPVEGWRVMEILRGHGIGMEGTCGGAVACASCHVILDPEWAAKVPPPREEELYKLDELPLVQDTSRLSCQIIWSGELDGLRLKLVEE
ncbi:MAG: 2Fe-2S iron-sulfur cluster binding domain-containing protein [Methylocystis sp.]|nr:2Fe-2S iron-sulfur cluster binding domain-containing protein [Methylocystis sp.]MBI3275480.1 2Fe-2S iron-sulfur cluster binding domain-containing protein [Methylocystis sp.]